MMRAGQAEVDRRINPNYIRDPQIVVQRLDSGKKGAVNLHSGLTVNVGDVIQNDGAYSGSG